MTTVIECFEQNASLQQIENLKIKILRFYTALKAITLPETGPRGHGVAFITHFIMQSRTYNNIYTTVLQKGSDILRTVIMCIGAITPRTHVDTFASIFVALNKNFPSEYIVWMQVLEMPQYPTHLISDKEKEHFAKALIK